jgi:hypothetical protein
MKIDALQETDYRLGLRIDNKSSTYKLLAFWKYNRKNCTLFTIKSYTLWEALVLTFNTITILGSEFHLANQCTITVVLVFLT